jgi:cephalosporin-C deacetylase-like acetyl esterase
VARFLHHPEEFNVLHAPYTALLEEYYARRGLRMVNGHPYPQTLGEWQTMRSDIRNRFIASLGLDRELVDAPPDRRGDLRARVVGEVDRSRDGYRIELIEYQTRPRFYVSANLYLPASPPAGRLPAVFSPHGHWQTGKHTRALQIRCANLARRGYAVLLVDTIGQSERTFMGHRDAPAHALLYAGASMPGLQVWDNIRGLDYLCSRPEVDATRIGVTGASGGGNHTMYLAAVDGRVSTAVPVCAVEMFDTYFRKSQCVCETVPDLLTYADKPHLLGLIAPRPLLIMNGLRDGGFSTLSARQAYDRTQQIYELHEGGRERLALYETNVEHSYDRAMRERAYAWFDQWLQGLSPEEAAARSREADTWVEAEEDETLCVWGHGSAGDRPDGAHTLATYYAQIAPPVAIQNPKSDIQNPNDLRRRIIDEAFGGWPERTPLRPEVVDTVERQDCAIELLTYWSEDEVPVPALLFRPLRTPAGRIPAVVYTSPAGKGRAPELRAVHEVVRAGAAVLAIDYRGQGETAAGGHGGGSQGELPAVERGILLHQPLFGGRVWDVLRGVEYLASRADVDPAAVYVWGEGDASLLALYAAALDERVAGAACLGGPSSYRAPAAGDAVSLAAWLVVPGLLALADVPQLEALVAPRLCVRGTPAAAAELVPGLWKRA